MFLAAGQKSREAELIKRALAASSIPFSEASDGFTCVVYRLDPITNYQFVLAMAGVRDRTPMYGPIVYDDLRGPGGGVGAPPNPYGFQRREGIRVPKLFARFPDSAPHTWTAWLSWRGEDEAEFDRAKAVFRSELVPVLDLLLGAHPSNQHLYPDLWNRERRALDALARSLESCEPLVTVEELVSQLKHGLRSALPSPGRGTHHVGLYLNTGTTWRLVGSADAALPRRIDHRRPQPDALNDPILTAVKVSTRPMLLSSITRNGVVTSDHPTRPGWRDRLAEGDRTGRLLHLIDNAGFSGAMVLPVLYPNDPSMTIAIVLVIGIHTVDLVPADLFVANSLARELGQHLAPHLPVAGYPYWPDEPLELSRDELALMPSPDDAEWVDLAERATRRMVPGRQFRLQRLAAGKSGTQVFRVDIEGRSHSRLPMALKVGSADAIVSEVMRYERFAEDTAIGQSSRLRQRVVIRRDTNPAHFPPEGARRVGAVLYTFVGEGDRVTQWTLWARSVGIDNLRDGLGRLIERLSCWYDHSTPRHGSVLDQVIVDEFPPSRLSQWRETGLVDPAPEQVWELVQTLARSGQRGKTAPVSIVHGDLHAGNVFTIAPMVRGSEPDAVADVAVIDWGLTDDRRFVMLDLAKLAVDIMFGVRWPVDSRPDEVWFDVANVLAEHLTVLADRHKVPAEWRYAYVQYLVKMLFYVDAEPTESEPGVGHLSPAARRAAFDELKLNVDYLCGITAEPPALGAGAALQRAD